MLNEIRIENFAIIEALELEFGSGLTTFTGETGAGKSIILDAITALMGGKVDATFIRAGAARAQVEGVFSIPEAVRGEVNAILQREDLLEDATTVVLSRELRREGRTIARVNGSSVSTALLRELGEYLVDIHGQSEHLSLLQVRQHLGLLDRYASSQTHLSRYQDLYRQMNVLRRELKALREDEADALRRMDLLTFQAEEIESARLKVDEEEELRRERDRLANAENLASLTRQCLSLLDEGSPEAPALSDLSGQLVQLVHNLARIDPALQRLAEQVDAAAELLGDLNRDLQDYQEAIEFNPRRLEQLEERLDLLHNLKRKYGGSLEAVIAFGDEARRKLDTIVHAGERIAALETLEGQLLEKLAAAAGVLSAHRRKAAQSLAQGVERELADLSMAGAQFKVDFQSAEHADGLPFEGKRMAFDETGIDRVEFLIAPNQGEGLKPLVKIASGGETSRLMLALKNVLARADYVSTLIFDEIDQGIGGRVGAVIGEKLWQLGRSHQVLCITHLPQLAAYGDQHFRVAKAVTGGRTATRVTGLEGETRIEELAQMIGPATEANRSAARAALQQAQQRAREMGRK